MEFAGQRSDAFFVECAAGLGQDARAHFDHPHVAGGGDFLSQQIGHRRAKGWANWWGRPSILREAARCGRGNRRRPSADGRFDSPLLCPYLPGMRRIKAGSRGSKPLMCDGVPFTGIAYIVEGQLVRHNVRCSEGVLGSAFETWQPDVQRIDARFLDEIDVHEVTKQCPTPGAYFNRKLFSGVAYRFGEVGAEAGALLTETTSSWDNRVRIGNGALLVSSRPSPAVRSGDGRRNAGTKRVS
jgi:hypothetical protein